MVCRWLGYGPPLPGCLVRQPGRLLRATPMGASARGSASCSHSSEGAVVCRWLGYGPPLPGCLVRQPGGHHHVLHGLGPGPADGCFRPGSATCSHSSRRCCDLPMARPRASTTCRSAARGDRTRSVSPDARPSSRERSGSPPIRLHKHRLRAASIAAAAAGSRIPHPRRGEINLDPTTATTTPRPGVRAE